MRPAYLITIILIGAAILVPIEVHFALKQRNASQQVPQRPVEMGKSSLAEGPSLKLTISNVRQNQEMINQPPWSASGGTWTVMDCSTGGSDPAVFTIALAPPPPPPSNARIQSQLPMKFAAGRLLPPTGENGAKLVAALSSAFKTPLPPRRTPQPLKPFKFSTAILGQNVQRDTGGSFGKSAGDWNATKWFLSYHAHEAEIFFNYNLAEGVAEFTEKDPMYRPNLMTVLATAVRDGPRPPRTPAEDPNLAADGPRVQDLRLIPNSAGGWVNFKSKSRYLLLNRYQKGSGTDATAFDAEHLDRPIPLIHVNGRIVHLLPLDPEYTRGVAEEISPTPEAPENGTAIRSPSSNSTTLWFFNRSTGEKRKLEGPWQSNGKLLYDDEAGLSPDRRYIVIQQWRPGTGAHKGGSFTWYILDAMSGSSVRVNPPQDEWVYWAGWTADEGSATRGVIRFSPRGKIVRKDVLLVNPISGECQSAAVDPLPTPKQPDVSPDGKLRFELEPGKYVDILDANTGQKWGRFTFNEDDQDYADDESLNWLSPRYIQFNTDQQGFIDVQTLKLSYLPHDSTAAGGSMADDEADRSFVYSPDFRWAARTSKSGVYLGRVVVPADKSPATQP